MAEETEVQEVDEAAEAREFFLALYNLDKAAKAQGHSVLDAVKAVLADKYGVYIKPAPAPEKNAA